MRTLFFATLVSMLVFTACQDDNKTPNGYEYVKLNTTNGKKGNPGDHGFVHVYVYHDSVLVNSSRDFGQPVPVTIPDPATLKSEDGGPGKSNPIADVVGLMSVGDSVSVLIPVTDELRAKAGEVLANVKMMTYNIVLAGVKNEEEYQEYIAAEQEAIKAQTAAMQAREPEVAALLDGIVKQYKNGELTDKIQSTSTGLKYMILEEGDGEPAQKGGPAQVQYYGVLTDGTMFDNSFKRGRPHNFTLGQGQVIAGWDIGIALLREGDKAVLFIPPDMGYGAADNGKIPGNSELIFYVEVEKPGN
jgi:FKBP-type peptidyl-prolyl cis-trans isomerase